MTSSNYVINLFPKIKANYSPKNAKHMLVIINKKEKEKKKILKHYDFSKATK